MIALHGFAGISVDSDYPWRGDVAAAFGDFAKIVAGEGINPAMSLSVGYSPNLSVDGQRHLYDGFYIGSGTFTDLERGVQLTRNAGGGIRLTSDRPAMEWVMWLTQIVLLSSGVCLVHAAAVEKDGQALLLASWGGVGKTAIVSSFVSKLGWRLLGDDLLIVSTHGECYAFPKPMVLYPYHRELFPEVFARGDGPIAPSVVNEFLGWAALVVKPLLRRAPALLRFARAHNPQSVRILPSSVFGTAALAPCGQITNAVWLERVVGIEEVDCINVDGSLPSRIIGSTINEFDARCVRGTNVGIGSGLLPADTIYQRWYEILEAGLKNVPQSLIRIPASLHVSQVPAQVQRILETSTAPAER